MMLSPLLVLAMTTALGSTAATQSSFDASLTLNQRVEQRRNTRLIAKEKSNQTTMSTLLKLREERRTARLLGNTVIQRSNKQLPRKQEVIDAVNLERAKQGIEPLQYNFVLEVSSQQHADDMQQRNYFAHETPEGKTSGDRIQAAGYGDINVQECHCGYKVSMGENLAKGQTGIQQVIVDWMASPPHREAILSRMYHDIGVGIADTIWVLNFGGVEMTMGRGNE